MGWTYCLVDSLLVAARRASRALRASGGTGHAHAQPVRMATAAPAACRPLRVLRVVDAAHPRATAGRMVISGRMADVCAELDRLAALEPAA